MLNFFKNIFNSKTDFKELIKSGAVIVDVRSPEEFKIGHIRGSINITVEKISGVAAKLKKDGKPIITCCRSGARSGMAKELLRQKGVEAYNGGAWDGLREKLG